MRIFWVVFMLACAAESSDKSSDDTLGLPGTSEQGGGLGDDGSGEGDSSSGDTDALWTEAMADHQFKYLYNASDYSEQFIYRFCADGTGSYSWLINSGGITGTASQNGGDQGTWEVVESNQSAANVKVVGERDGTGYIQLTIDADSKFYIDGARYYREYMPC